MTLPNSWFTEQLEIAARQVRKRPDWALREAGIDRDYLDKNIEVHDNVKVSQVAEVAPAPPQR
jgi:hypothetical protein